MPKDVCRILILKYQKAFLGSTTFAKKTNYVPFIVFLQYRTVQEY